MKMVQELLPYLPVLAAFSQTGQVTGAADFLGIPQPQVSRSLTRAEELTGLKLRQREGRTMVPTGAALELGAAARTALDQLNETLTNITSEFHGQISIAFQHSLGESLVPSVIKSFVAEQPAIEFALIQGSRTDCLTALETGRADVAFIAVVPDSLTMRSSHIYTEELVLAVPADHRLASHTSVTAGDIASAPLIAMRHGLGLRSTTDSLFERWGIAPSIAFEGQEISTVLGLVAAGLGVAIVPRRQYAHNVVLISFKNHDAHRPVVMASSRRHEPSFSAKLFTASVARFTATLD